MDLASSVSGLFEAFSFSPREELDDTPSISPTAEIPPSYPLDTSFVTMAELILPPTPDSPTVEPQKVFETPLPHLSPETNQYLRSKGAFNLLPIQLRNQLIGGYVKYVHPLLPILDLQWFTVNVMVQEDTHFISPLLYQSAMLAGSAFIEQKAAIDAGFSSRKSLRRTLFERAKLLYESDTEPDACIQIQALLLMMQWHGNGVGHKCPLYWFDLAYSTAERVGLLTSLQQDSRCCCCHHRHRLWWCLYVRDRILALGFRRPLRIPNSDITMSLLKSEKYSFSEPCPDVVRAMLDDDAAMFLGCESQEQMALLFIQEIKLAHCVGGVVELLYQDSWSPSSSSAGSAPRYCLLPKPDISQMAITACEQLLGMWIQNLPSTAHYYHPPDPIDDHLGVFPVHQAFLSLLQLTTMAILYQAAYSSSLQATMMSEMRRLTSLAHEILEELGRCSVLHFLPGSAVTFLLIILESGLPDLTVSNEIVRKQAMINLHACETAACHLLQTYPSAEIILFEALGARAHLLGLAMD
ncbi:hypothetical protein FE257_007858 [Aspergillus nanangensis]|uniref:Xylanolytic transcriptional activator regulatory domain-containing protein n=1 Tax=Aspergillus nanangensis TaxID=2582783 RepID=A0AAD4GZ39_ASPNN|nr:hypothetical protein FE257_007858 [Aspergillus nanangensis]